MDSFILSLALRWLPAEDVFSASCVCRNWNTVLNSDQDGGSELWKQVCQNTDPEATRNVVAIEPNWDFRCLARSLAQGTPPQVTPITFTPTLQLDSIFGIVELYRRPTLQGKRRRVVVGSWTCDQLEFPWLISTTTTGMVLKGANPFSKFPIPESNPIVLPTPLEDWYEDPISFAGLDALGVDYRNGKYGRLRPEDALRVKVTLFRREDMKSLCIMDDEIEKPFCSHFEMGDMVEVYPALNRTQLNNTKAGRKARLLMYERECTVVELDASFTLSEVNTPPGSNEERSWLAFVRSGLPTGPPTREDVRSLAKIPFFEFEVQHFSLNFNVRTTTDRYNPRDNRDDYERFVSVDDMMVALEGMSWR